MRLLVGGLACAALGLGAASVFAATPDTPYVFAPPVPAPDLEVNGRIPERLTTAQDVSGDGVTDLYASSYLIDVEGVNNVGRVYLFNGATRNLIRRIEAPDRQEGANFGFYISVPGDVNRDGIEDISVGAPSLEVDGNARQGRLYVFNGRTGSLIHSIDHPEPQAGASFASRIGAAGDVNGDGVADIIAGASGQDLGNAPNAGKAYVFSGLDGSLLSDYRIPEEDLTCLNDVGVHQPGVSCGSFGQMVQGFGDLNRDGVTDHMVGAGAYNGIGRIYVFSGADETVLTRIDPPEKGDSSSFFGLFDLDRFTPGDLTGDGVPEIYGNGFQLDRGNMRSAGRSWIFDGARSLQTGEGVVLYEIEDPRPADGKAFGFTASKTDYNHDGVNDLYITALANHEGSDVPQEAYVNDGRNGEPLKTLQMPPEFKEAPAGSDNGTGFGWSSRALGDVNGDCEPDYSAAAPFVDVEGVEDAGTTFFMLSSGPSACPAAVPPPPAPPAPPVSVCGDPDAAGYLHPAKLRVARARVLREDRRLDVLAPITSRAEGDVAVTFQADNRTDTFDEDISEANTELDVIRISEEITRGQARLGTGIVNIHYLGDQDTRPAFVRLRAASQRAELDVEEISLIGDRLSATGSVTDKAQGVVRLRFSYLGPDGTPKVHEAQAEIQDDGDWKLNNDEVPAQLAQCGGSLSIQFTGYFERRIRGEQVTYQLNAGQTRTP